MTSINTFEIKIKTIDKNIKKLHSNKLNLKESLILLKTTTNLLSSAKDYIISQHNTICEDTNNFLLHTNLEKYYNDLLIRKKTISDLTEKYKLMIKNQNQNENNILNFEENNDDIDNENNTLLNKDNNNIDLRLISDKNELLMQKGNKDLENICNDIKEIKNNIYKQGKIVDDLDEITSRNEKKAKSGEIIIDDIIMEQNCGKCLLVLFNILLFVLILAIIIYKLL